MKRRSFLKALGMGAAAGAAVPLVANDSVMQELFAAAPMVDAVRGEMFGEYYQFSDAIAYGDIVKGALPSLRRSCYKRLREQARHGKGVVDPKGLQVAVIRPGSGGTIDPVEQYATVGWKVHLESMSIREATRRCDTTLTVLDEKMKALVHV